MVSEKCKFYAISQSNKLQTTGHNERYITTIYNINEYIFYEYLPKGHEIWNSYPSWFFCLSVRLKGYVFELRKIDVEGEEYYFRIIYF